MSSQESSTSTIPYELFDHNFADELESVDSLYYGNIVAVNPDDVSSSDDDDGDDNESDSDGDDLNVNQPQNLGSSPIPYTYCSDRETSHGLTSVCSCKRLYGKPCCQQVDTDKLVKYRESCLEKTHDELDMIVKYQLYHNRNDSGFTASGKHPVKQRDKFRHNYLLFGSEVCRDTFAFAHAISRKTVDAITRDITLNCLEPRIHGNKNRLPKHALTMNDVQNIKQFLMSYGQQNGVPLPGRQPNYRHEKYVLLPSDKTKSDIHELYNTAAEDSNYRKVSLSEFKKIWLEHCPYILVMKPATDLCVKCQKYVHSIANSANLTEEQKQEKLEQYSQHIEKVKCERDYYRMQCESSRKAFADLPTLEKVRGQSPAVHDICLHYSFDYAQQVFYPHYAQQVGPLYFKTPRKCGCFGVCCESSGSQIFYLLDEAVSTDVGKGANSVVSMLHHHFSHLGYGEKKAVLHMDNCSGQNKNNTVIGYGVWRVSQHLHDELEFSLMEAGHTKFNPDWHFGLWKMRWRCSSAETMTEIADTVTRSSRSGHNLPQLVDDPNKPVLFYDWRAFFKAMFRPIPHLKKYHHFRMTCLNPGVVYVREYASDEEKAVNIMRPHQSDVSSNPDIIPQRGLDPGRAWYLYEEVAPLCNNTSACPRPSVPKPVVSLSASKSEKFS